ncbi:unnamed protein product, partial [Nesidiocoris tenuis]
VFMHGTDLESLHKHIDPENLPVEYGGSRPPFSSQLTTTIIQLNESKYEGVFRMSNVRKLRLPGSTTNSSTLDIASMTRDTVMSAISLFLLGIVLSDNIVGWAESSIMLLLYIIYVFVLTAFAIPMEPELPKSNDPFENCHLLRTASKNSLFIKTARRRAPCRTPWELTPSTFWYA